MNALSALGICLFACSASAFDVDDLFDRLDNALSVSALENNLRARLSGTLDVELYHFNQPAPALIDSSIDNLFNPRLTLFLDAQYGRQFYFFAQSRLDRGFDPAARGAQARLDEYALRVTPSENGSVNFQIGKFSTVVGNWVGRHLSWENPFVDAPLVYENITAISDKSAPRSPLDFVRRFEAGNKYEFNPVIWGPDYASGVSVFGRVGDFDYAAELKNAPLAARPESWSLTEVGFDRPAANARIGFRPNEAWNFGLSGGEGPYFRPEADRTLPPGHDLDDYRELVLGQDVSFALHHFQLWAEFYEARFEVPRVGDADTFAYYLEAKYQFAPQLFGAVRWNQQVFSTVDTRTSGGVRWNPDIVKIDVAGGYRATSHTQLKLQYSFQQETARPQDNNHIFAAQFTVRF
jgi:hypothetical protein